MFLLKKGLIAPFFVTQMSALKQKQVSQWLLVLFVFTAIGLSVKIWLSPLQHIKDITMLVAPYNNFLIFKWSGYNLINELPLYISNEPLHYDLYKYSPTCALAFLPLSWLPDQIGLFLWTAINIITPFLALQQIIGLNTQRKNILSFWLLAESVTSALNTQSNGLVLALLLAAIASFQRNQTGKTVLLILFSAFIKIFGLAFFLLFLLEPKRIPKAIILTFVYTGILLSIPLLFVSFDYLISEYRWWLVLLKQDGSHYMKLSILGWLNAWFDLAPPKYVLLIFGVVMQLILALAFLRSSEKPPLHEFSYRLGATLLLWVVLFNHMSESATYVVAIGGVVLFFSGEVGERLRWIWYLLTVILMFTILGPTDIYPKEIRTFIVERAQLKAFPVIVAWVLMWVLMVNSCIKRKKPEL